ncbi:MAG: DUF4276 family protein [bacterium]
MKFILFVEGHTERNALPAFLKTWLDPKLTQPAGIIPVRFNGWRELEKEMRKKAGLYLNRPDKDAIIAAIALLDLYGPTFYPKDKKTAKERYEWAKKYLEMKVGQERFRQFFAVHETEAWLLSDPSLFPTDVKKALSKKIKSPEQVNFDEPPAKLLQRLYKEKTNRIYKKTTHGSELFHQLDVELAYAKCARLKELLDEMFKLAKSAGL